MGFPQSRLDAINPGLIVTEITGFGTSGPYAERPAFDFIAQAMSSFMAVNGEPDGPPLRAAPPMSDLIAGLYCAFGVVCALQARHRTGDGQRVPDDFQAARACQLAAQALLLAERGATTQSDEAWLHALGSTEATTRVHAHA